MGKCREHISLLVILCKIVYVTNKNSSERNLFFFFFAGFLTDLHCRKWFLVLGTMLVNVTVEINRHEQCDSHDPASIPNTFLI